jgi:hypothetical protein
MFGPFSSVPFATSFLLIYLKVVVADSCHYEYGVCLYTTVML